MPPGIHFSNQVITKLDHTLHGPLGSILATLKGNGELKFNGLIMRIAIAAAVLGVVGSMLMRCVVDMAGLVLRQ